MYVLRTSYLATFESRELGRTSGTFSIMLGMPQRLCDNLKKEHMAIRVKRVPL